MYNVILNVAPRTVKYQDADYDTFRSALLINITVPVMDPEQPGKYTQITTYSTNNPVDILKLEKSGGERTILSWDGTFKLNLFPLLCRDKNWNSTYAWSIQGTDAELSVSEDNPIHTNNAHYAVLEAVSYTHLDVYKRQTLQ